MNSDFILVTLLYNKPIIINRCIFITSLRNKILSEYYCKLFCLKNKERFNNMIKESWIRKYAMSINLTKLLNICKNSHYWYTNCNFMVGQKKSNYLFCAEELLDVKREFRLVFVHKQYKKIPNGVFELINLQRLYLYENNITIIPSEIGNLTNLVLLDLTNNSLLYIPPNYDALNIIKHNDFNMQLVLKFRKLNLTIQSFPNELVKLNKLNSLYLSHNVLFGIPQVIYKIISLENIALWGNLIDFVDDNLQNLVKLNYLDLNDNLIKKMPDIVTSFVKIYMPINNVI